MSVIVTHQNVDMDAIGFVWLAKLLPDYQSSALAFASANNRADHIAEEYGNMYGRPVIVGDVGREHNGKTTFDHHQLDEQTSATQLIWQALLQFFSPTTWQHQWLIDIEPLVQMINDGDWMVGPAQLASRELGLHAKLNMLKRKNIPDVYLYETMASDLHLIAENLVARANARRDFAHAVIAKKDRWVLIEGKPTQIELIQVAYELGYQVVVYDFGSERGMKRAQGHAFHCGNYVNRIAHDLPSSSLKLELDRWFQHQAGFFAGLSPIGGAIMPLASDLQMIDIWNALTARK